MDLERINNQEKVWLLKEKYQGVESEEYTKECELIDAGMPVAYLIGNIEFLGCHIDLTSKPLIPRAETEFWVNQFINEYKKKYSPGELTQLDVLDVFSGSGCIGIALKKHLGCKVDFAELKSKHCEQIHKNLSINRLNIGSHVFESDVLDTVPAKKYDVIIANPPYVPYSHRDQLVQDSVLTYEDPDSIFAENDGNDLILKLIRESGEYLNDKSELYIEHDPTQTQTLLSTIQRVYNKDGIVWQDQYQRPRIIIIKNEA